MDLVIQKTELVKLLLNTQAVAEKKSTMPILGNILLQAEDNSLRVTGSDLEITAVSTGPAKVKKSGSITLSAKMLGDIVRELPDAEVSIKALAQDRVEISAGKSQLKLVGISADEYPTPPGISLPVKSRIQASLLSEMISKTIYSVSTDESRFTMSGICVELLNQGKNKKAIRMAATDGHRLALITRAVDEISFSLISKKESDKDHIIVPRKGMVEFKKALDSNPDTNVGIDVSEGFFVLESANTKLAVRLVDGEFPDYSQVLPTEVGTKVVVLSSEFAQALKRVALVVSDKNKCVRMDFSDGKVVISSSSPDLGEAKEELSVQYSGKPLSVGFNARYLLDMLGSVGESQPLVIELHGDSGPGKFYCETDESCLAIVMPLRLD